MPFEAAAMTLECDTGNYPREFKLEANKVLTVRTLSPSNLAPTKFAVELSNERAVVASKLHDFEGDGVSDRLTIFRVDFAKVSARE